MASSDHPAAYIEEIPTGVHPVTGVPTSITAFIGRAKSGPFDTAVRCLSFADFTRTFGGVHPGSRLAPCVRQFFDNGGRECYAVRPGNGNTGEFTPEDFMGNRDERTGLFALAEVDIFSLMVIPGDDGVGEDGFLRILGQASAYCRERRAFLLMDAPVSWTDPGTGRPAVDRATIDLFRGQVVPESSAVYFPGIRSRQGRTTLTMGPAGAIAGLFARTDAGRGVWKAPAGSGADLRNITGLPVVLTGQEIETLNSLGVNCLKKTPAGIVVWGARTMAGADYLGYTDGKYIPVRRLALFIEESVFRATQWVIFEPNDEPLWAAIRLNVGAFMHRLFRQGAFMGSTPRDAYFVKCDRETITADDQARGIVNLIVGFAPVKPAEFVILRIQQAAGSE